MLDITGFAESKVKSDTSFPPLPQRRVAGEEVVGTYTHSHTQKIKKEKKRKGIQVKADIKQIKLEVHKEGYEVDWLHYPLSLVEGQNCCPNMTCYTILSRTFCQNK